MNYIYMVSDLCKLEKVSDCYSIADITLNLTGPILTDPT